MRKTKTDADLDLSNFDFDKELAKLGATPGGAAPSLGATVPAKLKPVLPARTASAANPFWVLLVVTLLSVVLWFVPYAEYAVYPFRLFVTFIHEIGHALAAMVTGGRVLSIAVAWNTSGLTYSQGGFGMLIASAGYLGSMLFGCLLLLGARSDRLTKPALAAVGLLILGFTLFYGGTVATWLIGLPLAAALLAVAFLARRRLAHYFLSLLSVQCVLNAIYDLKSLFVLPSQARTDAVILSEAFRGFIPPTAWAALWSGAALIMLLLVLFSYYRMFRAKPVG